MRLEGSKNRTILSIYGFPGLDVRFANRDAEGENLDWGGGIPESNSTTPKRTKLWVILFRDQKVLSGIRSAVKLLRG